MLQIEIYDAANKVRTLVELTSLSSRRGAYSSLGIQLHRDDRHDIWCSVVTLRPTGPPVYRFVRLSMYDGATAGPTVTKVRPCQEQRSS